MSAQQTNSIKNAISGGGGSGTIGGGGRYNRPYTTTTTTDTNGFAIIVFPVVYDDPPSVVSVTSSAPGFSYSVEGLDTTYLLIKTNSPSVNVSVSVTGVVSTGRWKFTSVPYVFSVAGSFTTASHGIYPQTLTIPPNYTAGSPLYYVSSYATQYSPASSPSSQNLMYGLQGVAPPIVLASGILEPGNNYSVQIQDYFGSPINQPTSVNLGGAGLTPGQTITMQVYPAYPGWTMTNPSAVIWGVIYQ